MSVIDTACLTLAALKQQFQANLDPRIRAKIQNQFLAVEQRYSAEMAKLEELGRPWTYVRPSDIS